MGLLTNGVRKVLGYLPDIEARPEDFVESDGYGQFYKSLYDAGLVIQFDWMKWAAQAQEYVNRPELIDSADLDTICKLITTDVRTDRFCDNHLRTVIMNGHMSALLRRLVPRAHSGTLPSR